MQLHSAEGRIFTCVDFGRVAVGSDGTHVLNIVTTVGTGRDRTREPVPLTVDGFPSTKLKQGRPGVDRALRGSIDNVGARGRVRS